MKKQNPENFDEEMTQTFPKEKEFNLSEKIEREFPGLVAIEDVKEFIKRLKENIKMNTEFNYEWFFNHIDKLAGDKLRGGE